MTHYEPVHYSHKQYLTAFSINASNQQFFPFPGMYKSVSMKVLLFSTD